MSTPAPRPPQRHSRGNPSLGDIVRSVVVLGAIVLVVYLVAQLIYGREPDDLVPKVDHERAIADARQAADQRLFAPAELPDGWRANGARFDPSEHELWHLGVITDEDQYIGLDQADRSVTKMVDEFAPGTTAAGSVEINGISWERRTGADGFAAYIAEIDDTIVVVTSDAPRPDLQDYMSSLDAS